MRSVLRKHSTSILVAVLTALLVGGPAVLHRGDGSTGSVASAQTTLTNCPAPTVNNSPCIKYGFKDGPVVLTNTLTTIAALPLGPGRYVINAKLYFGNQSSWSSSPHRAECQLVAGPNFDWAKGSIARTLDQGGATYDLTDTMTLIVGNRFTEAGAAELKCASINSSGVLRAHFIKITAQKVGTLIRVNM